VVGVGLGRSQRCDMTPKQLAVIERARRLPTRIVQIPPRRGVRVGDAMRKLREQDTKRLSEILEANRRCRVLSALSPV